MGDYVPLFEEGDEITVTISAAVTGGQLLKVSGSDTVAPAGAGDKAVGTAAFDAANVGDKVTMYGRGRVDILTASGGITAGDNVVPGAAGTAASLAAVTTPTPADVTNTRAIYGIALTTATDGNPVKVMEV